MNTISLPSSHSYAHAVVYYIAIGLYTNSLNLFSPKHLLNQTVLPPSILSIMVYKNFLLLVAVGTYKN